MGNNFTYTAQAEQFRINSWMPAKASRDPEFDDAKLFSFPYSNKQSPFHIYSIIITKKHTYCFLFKGAEISFFELDDPTIFTRKKAAAVVEAIAGSDFDQNFINAFKEDIEVAVKAGLEIPLDTSKSIRSMDDMVSVFEKIKGAGLDPIAGISSLSKKYGAFFKEKKLKEEATLEYKTIAVGDFAKNYTIQSAAKIKEAIKVLDKKWKSLSFDKKNPVQESIARSLYYGNDIVLLGETGIGKTFSPNSIAKNNNIAFHMIQFQLKTDSIDLHGADVLTTSFLSPDATMKYRYGLMAKAFISAREDYKAGKPSILLLDELFRAEDSSPLISSLSTFDDTKEYALTLPNEIEYIKIKTGNAGDIWLKIDSNIDKERQGYEVVGGNIFIKEEMIPFICADEQVLEVMASRGDLMTITEEDARRVRSNIQKTKQAPEVIRIPSRALSIIATSNIGENYDINMGMDNALFRRLKPTPVATPSVALMVDLIMDNYIKDGIITSQADLAIRNITKKFLEGVDKLIVKKQIDTIHKINFSTVDDIIKGVDGEDPFCAGFGNIFSVLQDKATHFANIDSGTCADDMIKDRSVTMILASIKELEKMVKKGDAKLFSEADLLPLPEMKIPSPGRGNK